MFHRMPAAVLALLSINAHALEGLVVDAEGTPVADARIEMSATPQAITTDAEGRFSLPDGVSEIHVTAPGYGHRVVHLHDVSQDMLRITLAPTAIEQLDVIGLPIHASVTESALPVTVLAGDALREQQAATLGDTLAGQVGVHTSFHGNVASSPIIRGLSGPRVLITQNSLDVSDVSRVGPDHSVASEVSTAQQVEILRGPATLFYGSGAIGGVVNVVDQRVPTDSETRGEALVSHDTVNNQNLTSFNLNSGFGDIALHADGFWRDADDYEVPVAPERELDHHKSDEPGHSDDFTVANTGETSSGYTLGASYLLDNGYVGISTGRLEREYGIPGHGDEADEHEEDTEQVYADLKQDRYQLISELDLNTPWLRAINTRAAYTDYTHAEVENGAVGTEFSNTTAELRMDLLHQEFAHWRGGVNLHYKNSKVAAKGEEAFTPPSETETLAFAVMEERHIGDVLIQLGARAERVTVTAEHVPLPELEIHGHDGHDAGEHDEEQHGEGHAEATFDQQFSPVSVSVGAVWDFYPGYNLGVSLSRSQRAPSASELLSFGPHIGTRSYEIGALFALHTASETEDDEPHFDMGDGSLKLETSNNVDLTFRKHEGSLGLILNAFYNEVDNYYYQSATGLFAEGGHEHGAAEADAHEGELPIYITTNADATLHGFEVQGVWQISSALKATLFSDYVRAKLEEGSDLPRTPPLRYGARFNYQQQSVSASLSWTHYQDQTHVAALESTTAGYDWMDASVSYHIPAASHDMTLFLQAENLTDTEARVHTSFLKAMAPRPGRNVSVGLRASF